MQRRRLYLIDGTRGLLPVAALLYAATFWGLVWYPVRELEELGVAGLWQTLVAYGAALITLALLRPISLSPLHGHARDAFWLALASGWTNVAFLLAVLDGEVVRVLILFYLSPLWAVLLGRWLLHEAIRPHTGLMLALGLIGAAIMLWQPQALDRPANAADWLALSSGFAFALTNVMTRRMRVVSDRIKTQLAWVGVVAISMLWLMVVPTPLPEAAPMAWLGTVLLGVLGFFFSTLAVVYAVSRMPVQRSSVIMLFEILVGAVSAWWIAAEAMQWREWFGGAMIVAAGLIAVYYGEKDVD